MLEEIIDDLRLYGHASLVRWIQLKSNLEFIDGCGKKVLLIKDLSRYVSLFGEDREKLLFVTDFCGDICYRVCSSSSLGDMLNFVLRNKSFLRRFLLVRFLDYSLSLYPDEAINLIEEIIYSDNEWVKMEDKLLMAHVVSKYDFGFADDFFNRIYNTILRDKDHKSKLLNIIKFAYFYLRSFGDNESKKFAKDLIGEALDWIHNNPDLQVRVLPYLFHLKLDFAEKLFDQLLLAFDISKVGVFLDESFYLSVDVDIYYRLLERGKKLFESNVIGYDDYLVLVSKVIRNVSVADPYLAKIIFMNHTTAFTGLTDDNHDKAVEILHNLALVDIDFVYDLAVILIREANNIRDALRILVDLQDIFPRKVEEIFKYELLDQIRRLRLDELIELSDLIYSIKAEAARRIISRIIYQTDKSGDVERKLARLLRFVKKIAKIDPMRVEQLCMYTYELTMELELNKRVKFVGEIINTLQLINSYHAIQILQETIDTIEQSEHQNVLSELESTIKNEENPMIKQAMLYIRSKIKRAHNE